LRRSPVSFSRRPRDRQMTSVGRRRDASRRSSLDRDLLRPPGRRICTLLRHRPQVPRLVLKPANAAAPAQASDGGAIRAWHADGEERDVLAEVSWVAPQEQLVRVTSSARPCVWASGGGLRIVACQRVARARGSRMPANVVTRPRLEARARFVGRRMRPRVRAASSPGAETRWVAVPMGSTRTHTRSGSSAARRSEGVGQGQTASRWGAARSMHESRGTNPQGGTR
jgi:hypothetical protein